MYYINIITSALKNFSFHEPLESNNKIFKRFREHFARKNSRKNNLYDVFWRVNVSSDPLLLNHFFKLKRNLRQKKPFPQAVINLCTQTTQYGGLK